MDSLPLALPGTPVHRKPKITGVSSVGSNDANGANNAKVMGSIPIQAKLCNVSDQCREETNNYEQIRQYTMSY